VCRVSVQLAQALHDARGRHSRLEISVHLDPRTVVVVDQRQELRLGDDEGRAAVCQNECHLRRGQAPIHWNENGTTTAAGEMQDEHFRPVASNDYNALAPRVCNGLCQYKSRPVNRVFEIRVAEPP